MFAYTLGFIKKGDMVLMLNREKQPWLGCWNGLGGKIKKGEDALLSMQRELIEETDHAITLEHIKPCGYLTWNSFDVNGQGLYLFLIEVDDSFDIKTPKATDEGLLDWKNISWVIDENNLGVAHNIKHFLPIMLSSEEKYHYHCTFEGNQLVSVMKEHIL
ncbi:MAG: NUDIX domain-containing protein [Acholeplasmataceae bacterium]|jgi:8-oxo-dGTP diphosphatase|nr:NUDIX domain-containing protein [Acholeplasmataceae bacterium]